MASLKYILLFLSAATYGTYVTASTMKPGYGIVNESENINVTCGEPFTMSCTLNTSVNCTWKRNGAVIKAEDGRYSSQLTNYTCTFNASAAQLIDNGNWSCGTLADDDHDGVISENITVIVTKIPGGICKTVTTVPTDVFITPPDGGMTKYIYVSVGVSAVIILILTFALIYVYRAKRKTKIEGRTQCQNTRITIPLNSIKDPSLKNENQVYQNLKEASKTEKRLFADMEERNNDAEIIYSQVMLSRVDNTLRPDIERTEYATISPNRNYVNYENTKY